MLQLIVLGQTYLTWIGTPSISEFSRWARNSPWDMKDAELTNSAFWHRIIVAEKSFTPHSTHII